MALRIFSQMRWMGLTLLLLGGCGQPVDESHPPPFLVLRHNQPQHDDDPSPDGGGNGLQPIGDPGDPGKPID